MHFMCGSCHGNAQVRNFFSRTFTLDAQLGGIQRMVDEFDTDPTYHLHIIRITIGTLA
jgi:hypothetical protein